MTDIHDSTPEHTLDADENVSQGDPTDTDLQSQVEHWKDTAYRMAADAENARRRARAREQELVLYAAEHTITKMLPILDDLHNALEAAQSSSDSEALRKGVEMIYAKAWRIFEESGVRVIDADPGTPFDVAKHEALMHMPSDHPEGHIVQQVQRGFLLHDKVLRHTKVVTSAGTGETP
ncbi:MAG: nucleotide exchange factor GrpE [Candidatus Kapabacteria bacterium]|jgi:molecular chaperone GrpE|nr:nucleotide exchange factor GrpE [Candidatus Kapabacteria bacterium]